MPFVNRSIEIAFQKEAIHRYPEAATDPRLVDVSFLAFPHRHILHFKVRISVEHNNRDLEFILVKRFCESLYAEGTLEADYKSMEMLAEDLINKLREEYGEREYDVGVFEDGENGGWVAYVP
jgi:hypothetical protein